MLKQASGPQQPTFEPTTSLCSNGPKGLRARSAACGAVNQSDAHALEPCLRILPPKKESEHVRRRQPVIYLPAAMLSLLCAGVWEATILLHLHHLEESGDGGFVSRLW